VEVTFRTTKLRKCYENHTAAQRAWGEAVARKYVERINLLHASQTLQDLTAFPQLRFHPLKGAREGEYALALDARMRLIVTFHGTPPTRARIEEVSRHYGD
jgi:proteic killer suppression protein